MRGQDERAAWLADEESFQDHWNHHDVPFETWTQLMIDGREEFDPTVWWLAFDGGEVAGVAMCDPAAPGQPELGWVATLGVRRPWRGRGIASALLLTAFAEFQRRGKRGVSLGVDTQSPTGADRLYLRAGMRSVTDTAVYAKEIRAATPYDAIFRAGSRRRCAIRADPERSSMDDTTRADIKARIRRKERIGRAR